MTGPATRQGQALRAIHRSHKPRPLVSGPSLLGGLDVEQARTIHRPEETTEQQRKPNSMDCVFNPIYATSFWDLGPVPEDFDSSAEPTPEELETLERLEWDPLADLGD